MIEVIQESKCWQCSSRADGYDFLSQKHYCCRCFSALEETARHKHYNHVKTRLVGRYGIELDLPMYFDMLSQINNSATHTLLYKINVHKSVHKVTVNNKPVIVIYRKRTRSICTALPSKARFLDTELKGFINVK